AFHRLVHRHDALRLRFAREADRWRQYRVDGDATTAVVHVDLSALSTVDRACAMRALATRLRDSLDITAGPLTALALVDEGGALPTRVAWSVHHLAVDGGSWRVLIDDFAQLYEHGVAPADPAGGRSIAFAEW